MGIGKWIGGVLGFMAFGPLGALAGIILGSFFEEGASMAGSLSVAGTNYDDDIHEETHTPGNVTVSFSPCWLWHPISSVPTGRSCIARWNTSVNSSGETSAR